MPPWTVEEKKKTLSTSRIIPVKSSTSTPGRIFSTVNVMKNSRKKDDCVLGILPRSKTSLLKPKLTSTSGRVTALKKVFEGSSPLRKQVRNSNPNCNPFAVQAAEQLFVPANCRTYGTASLGPATVRTQGLERQARTAGNRTIGKSVLHCTARKGKKKDSFRIIVNRSVLAQMYAPDESGKSVFSECGVVGNGNPPSIFVL